VRIRFKGIILIEIVTSQGRREKVLNVEFYGKKEETKSKR